MSVALPLVSIVTPVYNGAKYIGQLIESVSRQDYPHIEHIVIDDGSDDDGATVAVLKQYPHLRWWSRENRGQYPTMNEGLHAASGELVCFISADDLMASGAVQAVVDEFLLHPEYDGVYGKIQWIREDGSRHYAQEVVSHAPLWLHKYKTFISHCSLYIKKQSLIEHGLLFDPSLRYLGDYDWTIRIVESSLKLGYINRVLSHVRYHSQQTSIVQADAIKQELRILQKRHRVNRALQAVVLKAVYGITVLQILRNALASDGIKGAMRLIAERLVNKWRQ